MADENQSEAIDETAEWTMRPFNRGDRHYIGSMIPFSAKTLCGRWGANEFYGYTNDYQRLPATCTRCLEIAKTQGGTNE